MERPGGRQRPRGEVGEQLRAGRGEARLAGSAAAPRAVGRAHGLKRCSDVARRGACPSVASPCTDGGITAGRFCAIRVPGCRERDLVSPTLAVCKGMRCVARGGRDEAGRVGILSGLETCLFTKNCDQ